MGTSTSSSERRDVPRRPFEGTVELTFPDDGESYEADAINLSVGGMAVRTAFLPDVGSELGCRFALRDGHEIRTTGEVMWARDSGVDEGCFGLQFKELDRKDTRALERDVQTALVHETPSSRPAKDAGKEQASNAMPPGRARILLPDMQAPLRAQVKTTMDDVIVLGADLSFLKLGEKVDVERAEGKISGSLEEVGIEVDDTTRVARLVLTVSVSGNKKARVTEPGKRIAATVPATAPRQAAPAPRHAMPATAPEPAPAPVARVQEPRAQDSMADSEESPREASASESAGDNAASSQSYGAEDNYAGRWPNEEREKGSWLDNAMVAMRKGASLAMEKTVSVAKGLSRAVGSGVAKARGAQPAMEAPAQRGPALRKQHVAGAAQPMAQAVDSATRSAMLSRKRKIGFGALALLGLVAIVFALASSKTDPKPKTPKTMVAVNPLLGGAPADPNAADPNANAAAPADPNATASTEEVDPNAVPAEGDPQTEAPASDSQPAPAPAPRRAPGDFQAAQRSPGPVAMAPSQRTRTTPSAPTARVAAVNNGPSTTRVIGTPSVTRGTTLRLRMDGHITQLTGGSSGNVISLRMPGRHSLDLAAPLVRQDLRLINAGVMNRSTGAELTLRFRADTAPQFSARAVGNTLEIVLAPAARTATAATHTTTTAANAAHNVISVRRTR